MRWIAVAALLAVVQPASAAKCRIDWWKMERDSPITKVYGQVARGTARIVYVELWRRGDLVAESWSYANPRGVFEVQIATRQRPRKSTSVRFSCE